MIVVNGFNRNLYQFTGSYLKMALAEKIQPVANNDLPKLPEEYDTDVVGGVKNSRHTLLKEYVQCDICHTEFQTHDSLDAHSKDCIKNKIGAIFNQALVNNDQFLCKVCGEGFDQVDDLTRHCEIHNELRLKQEPDLLSLLDKGSNMVVPIRKRRYLPEADQDFTLETLYTCDLCGKKFNRKCNMKLHRDGVHSKVKRFECDLCGKTFTQKSSLQTHNKIHTGEKEFECSECGKRFILKSDMHKHFRSHTGEKPYQCFICLKSYTSSGNLQKHKRIHSGEKPFECGVCGKKFGRSSTIQRHMLIHTGEKPHICDFCGKAYRYKNVLNDHIRSRHTERKGFDCILCGHSFNKKKELKEHERQHRIDRMKSNDFVVRLRPM